uniref:DUF4485 domain-containing protein n=1 Tax=Hucho hucho TaxID=62062 RepID=A0A4W5QNK2_9TELE
MTVTANTCYICIETSSSEETWEKLNSEFDHHLVDMKPYVLKLPHKTERQQCALWIKKLCDPGVSGSGLMGLKNRNMYARLLLHMLRRGVLEGPFSHKPESGSLKTLPTYMSIYFDEPLCGRGLEQSTAGLPDWVTGELGQDFKQTLFQEAMLELCETFTAMGADIKRDLLKICKFSLTLNRQICVLQL